MKPDVLERIFDGSIQPRDIPLSVLESITENFSEDRIIGEGGFGTVYKGVLLNGEVAVKRIHNRHTIEEKLFQREVNSLLMVNHRNIVRFLGFCSHTVHKPFKHKGSREYIYAEDRERILCFEYINNRNLEKYITDELRGLQWDTRYFIIKGICEGLHYLHMEKQIIHRDLKPANILIDNNMVAKITDFGLSRMEENAHTKSTSRVSSLGYTAPEYIEKGEMSVKYDVYSLGVIIIELVTGHRCIPDSNTVLRRWRHRWHKSGEITPFRYQQITKLIEIGLLCQEKDPYKRPFISDVIRVIIELESMDRKISDVNKSVVGVQISAHLEDDMLGIEPLELRFPLELNKLISCSVELTNETNAFIAFSIQTTSPLTYCIQPNKDIVAPRSKYIVTITLQPLDKAPQDRQYTGDFIVRSTKVNESLISEDITGDIFKREEGKLVDEVNLTVTFKAELPKVDVSLGSLIISDTRNLQSPQESSVRPTETESKISASTSDEVIQFDPPELCFPLVPNKKVLSSIKIVNVTESYVSFAVGCSQGMLSNYSCDKVISILPPRSTESLTVIRNKTEDAVIDMQFNDEFFNVWYAVVAEDIKASDLDLNDHTDYKKLPIVLTKMNSRTSNELIQFDPAELSFPCLNKTSFSLVDIVNITDCYIGFSTLTLMTNVGYYDVEPSQGILPPRSTRRIVVKREPTEKTPEQTKYEDSLYVWNMIVAEGVKASNISYYKDIEDSKELPLISNVQVSDEWRGGVSQARPCFGEMLCTLSLPLQRVFFLAAGSMHAHQQRLPSTSDELIQLDNPGLRFTLLKNQTAISSINMVNITNFYVGFHLFNGDTTVMRYHIDPQLGILAPRSAQRLIVARLIKENESQDTQYNDSKLFMWNAIVTEGVKASDLNSCMSLMEEQSIELPVILTKATSSTPVNLIKFEPPEVRFPFLPSKSLLSSIKIVNITDYHIGFNTRMEETNVAVYITEPPCGILPPRSTQDLVVTRVAKEEAPELEDMQCKDKYFVWSGFVTEDVNASDLEEWMPITERKKLPIVFTETSSNELIQFDPPELCLPLLPNQRLLSSAKIVNITDQYVGFRICTKKSNSARYNANPSEGILAPLSTQVLLVTRIADEKELEDTPFTDMFLVWNGIVTDDVEASNAIHSMSEIKCTNLPIVLTKTSSSTSDELIQFDPPELHIPFIPNKKVSTSVKIVNLTDYNVGFNTYSRPTNAAWYHTEPPRGILPPRSTQKLMVTREEKEDALKDKQFDDKYFVWKSIVSEGVKDNYLIDYMSDQESTELPIVPDKICSSIPDELIQLDPAELCIPLLLNKRMLFRVNVVNITDFYVAFNAYWIERHAPWNKRSMKKGILPPRSTEKYIMSWTTTEAELQDMECLEDFFVWNRVVTEHVESGGIISYMGEEESKKLPLILNKGSPCTSNEPIKFNPSELSLPLMPNKQLVFSVNIVNTTDYCIAFYAFRPTTNTGWYYVSPEGGVMPPRSTQRIVVKRAPKKKEQKDMQCEDKFSVWSCLVSEGVEASDFVDRMKYSEMQELPIAYKTSLCTSDELIKFDPPELPFPFLPNKRVSMLRKFKIANVTDHIVGFSTWAHEDNSARYKMEPDAGILPPQSTQTIKVRRTLKEKETEDMQCKDKIFVWNGIVTEGVEVSDVGKYWKDEDKELPVVLTKPGESSSG